MAGRIPAGVRVYTDLDHTMLGDGGRLGAAGEEARDLLALGVEVVPVTSKSVAEAYYYLGRLGLEESTLPAAIAETGAAIVLAGRLEPLAEARVYGVPIIPLSRGRVRVDEVIPGECRGEARILSRLDPREAAELTGLPPVEARLATMRVYDEAVHAPSGRCRRLIAERAAALGYTVLEGKRFIHVANTKGKARAVHALERLAGKPRLRILAGDSPLDRDLLELPGVAVVVPRPPGPRVAVRPARADYIVAPHPAPEGWVWMARRVVKPLTPLASSG
ncbi:hypothetical protein [Stetteria hydrogenophila]